MRTGLTRRHFITVLAGVSLAGCTGASMPKIADGPPRVSMRRGLQLGTAPVKGSDVTFALTEISGAPRDRIIMMERAISTQAGTRKLSIVSQDGSPSTYLIRGYLSAIGDRSGTLLVHVWDVTDATGQRLHRFSGQESGGGSTSDPWTGIGPDTVETAASRMVDDLAAWIS